MYGTGRTGGDSKGCEIVYIFSFARRKNDYDIIQGHYHFFGFIVPFQGFLPVIAVVPYPYQPYFRDAKVKRGEALMPVKILVGKVGLSGRYRKAETPEIFIVNTLNF
jgi:hypothetical protein